jgi:hypothetical protein
LTSLLVSGIVTSAVGCEFSLIVKVVVPPASEVLPLTAEMVMPALSLSTLLSATDGALRPL